MYSTAISYVGCFADSNTKRALSNITDLSGLGYSGIKLITACQNLAIENNASYFGMESMNLCAWGPLTDVFNKNGPSTNCTAQCGFAPQIGSFPTCGSSNSIDLYIIGSSNPLSSISMNKQYLYRGCYVTYNDSRVLPNYYALTSSNYLLECLGYAKSTSANFFGLEYGYKCFTGMLSEILTKNGPKQLESRCNYDCGIAGTSGGGGVKCGDGNATSNFF